VQVSSQHALAALLIRLRQLPQARAVLDRCMERLHPSDGSAGAGRGTTEALALEAET
jgi:hypothetical protein